MKSWGRVCIVAACLALSGAASAAPDVFQATDEQKAAASTAFGDGMAAFEAERFEDALAAFRKSYEAVASPNSHYMIGRTLLRMQRYAEAYHELVAAAAEADAAANRDEKYRQTADATRAELTEVEGKVARVTVKLRGGVGTVKLNGRQLDAGEVGRSVVVDPGSATIEWSVGGERGSETVTLGEAESRTVEVGKEPAVEGEAPAPATVSTDSSQWDQRTWAYVAGGVGAAGVVTFAIFGILNNQKFGSLEDDCPNGACDRNRDDDIDAGRRYQTIANVGLVLGVIGLGTGAALYFTSEPASPEEGRTAVRVGPGTVSLWGSF